MSRVIRRGVFETNSSSSHSVSIRKGDISDSYLTVDPEDNRIRRIWLGI
jgi:CTP:phosphocholine cytidylyltransferase-like protein